MNDSLDQLSDLEIYVKSKDLDSIMTWLISAFEDCVERNRSKKGLRAEASHEGHKVPITVSINSGGQGFSSIWIDSKQTPWRNDIEMAREAFKHFDCPIRCSDSAWQEGDDPDVWLEITAEGEHQVKWPNN